MNGAPAPFEHGLEIRRDRHCDVGPTRVVVVLPERLLPPRRLDQTTVHLDVVIIVRMEVPEGLEPSGVRARFVREPAREEMVAFVQKVGFAVWV